jgi:hypothetical protein
VQSSIPVFKNMNEDEEGQTLHAYTAAAVKRETPFHVHTAYDENGFTLHVIVEPKD